MMVSMMILCVLSGVLQDDPSALDELLARADKAFAAQDYGAAVEFYRQVIRADAHNVKALHALARLYTTASDPLFFDGKLAVELALMALDEMPDDPEIISTLALGYFAQNKFERAIKEYERASGLNPHESDYLRQIRKVATTWRARLEMMQPGRDTAEKALATFYVGKALFLLGDTAEALDTLENAYLIGGARKETCLYLARACIALGAASRAVEVLDSLDEAASADPEVMAEKGRACFAAGDLERALKLLQQAYDLDPEVPGLRVLLGKVYLQDGKNVKAAMVLKEAHDRVGRRGLFTRDEEAEILYLMGRALVEAEARELAMGWILEALEIQLENEEAERTLLNLYVKQFGSDSGFWEYLDGLSGGGAVSFVEASSSAGIEATGCPAFGDFDNDGDPDLLLSGSLFYENVGRGRFTEATNKVGLENAPLGGGVFGDVDNDGHLDLLVIEPRIGYRDRLFLNTGRQAFRVKPEGEDHPGDLFPTRSVAMGDLNKDGFLDIYLANGRHSDDPMERNYPDNLFLSTGPGTYENSTNSSGLGGLDPLCSMSVNMADFDNDGDLDIYVVHDYLAPNRLWRNDGKGRFTEEAQSLNAAGVDNDGRFGNSKAAVFGDVDNDGDLDLFLANAAQPRFIPFADQSMLLMNSGRPEFTFMDRTASSGVLYEPSAYQPALNDVNNDGLPDLFLCAEAAGEPARLYLGRGHGVFSDITWLANIRVDGVKGCAFADVDLDGDVDLFVGGADRPYLYLNKGRDNQWIALRLQGVTCNASGIGARVIVDYGGMSQTREVAGGRGAACQDEMVLLFGLGDYKGRVNVSIQWPDGKSGYLNGLKSGKVHIVKGRK
jgi:tetratricopeptide (TPR) repeat protein